MPPATRSGRRKRDNGDDELSGLPPMVNSNSRDPSCTEPRKAVIKACYRSGPKSAAPVVDLCKESSEPPHPIVQDKPADPMEVKGVEVHTEKPKRKSEEVEPTLDAKRPKIAAEPQPETVYQPEDPLQKSKEQFFKAFCELEASALAEAYALRARVATLEHSLLEEQADHDELQVAHHELQTDVLKYKKKNFEQTQKLKKTKNLEAAVEELNMDKTQLRRENEKLKKELEKKQQEYDVLDEEYSETLKELKPDYGDPDKVTDDEISSKWGQMRFRIANIAGEYFPFPLRTWDSVVDPSVTFLIDDCRKNPPDSAFYLQLFIWRRVCSDIFRCKDGLWGGNMGETLVEMIAKMSHVNRNDPKNLSLLSRMKFKAGKDIDMDVGLNNQVLSNLSTKLWEDLKVLVPRDKHAPLNSTLGEVMKTAAKLMVIMARSRAIWTVATEYLQPNREPCPFDAERMNIAYTDTPHMMNNCSAQVTLLVSPYLEKTGTADGDKFDCRCILGKAQAVVRLQEMKGSKHEETEEAEETEETEDSDDKNEDGDYKCDEDDESFTETGVTDGEPDSSGHVAEELIVLL
ncbi:hypothetical protein HIM_04054 [Hirsutella minnesotensis 3608]|uniref:Uncharacterized protein n=1 Tax=Hirsutella minnesotensis 3608 TaxID=1043627 RepID=A0A0F7ZVJ4_9HYPO|nr:hypothetical protein HIM_04054 [Hirsutella minnesotensis 3608]